MSTVESKIDPVSARRTKTLLMLGDIESFVEKTDQHYTGLFPDCDEYKFVHVVRLPQWNWTIRHEYEVRGVFVWKTHVHLVVLDCHTENSGELLCRISFCFHSKDERPAKIEFLSTYEDQYIEWVHGSLSVLPHELQYFWSQSCIGK